MAIRIVSDGSPLGVKVFDEENNDITKVICKNCTSINIELNAAQAPVASFNYTLLPFDITAEKSASYKDAPLIHFWNGKRVEKMDAKDIRDFYEWHETHCDAKASTDAIIAVNKRHREISST